MYANVVRYCVLCELTTTTVEQCEGKTTERVKWRKMEMDISSKKDEKFPKAVFKHYLLGLCIRTTYFNIHRAHGRTDSWTVRSLARSQTFISLFSMSTSYGQRFFVVVFPTFLLFIFVYPAHNRRGAHISVYRCRPSEIGTPPMPLAPPSPPPPTSSSSSSSTTTEYLDYRQSIYIAHRVRASER